MSSSLVDSLPGWFRRTSGGQQVIAEHLARQRKERKHHSQAIAEADAALERALPPLDRDLAKARSEVTLVELQLVAARQRALNAEKERFQAKVARDAIVHSAQAALLESADPAIDGTARDLEERILQVMRTGTTEWSVAEGDRPGGPAKKSNYDEAIAMLERLRALRPAIAALTYYVEDDLLGRLNAIRADAGLPPLAETP